MTGKKFRQIWPPVWLHVIYLPALVILLSCAGIKAPSGETPDPAVPEEEAPIREEYYPVPPGLSFIPAGIPVLKTPPGVGIITRDRRDLSASLDEGQKSLLSGGFKAAYIEALLRDVPLNGVLGGDQVHFWESAAGPVWVQNWRSSTPAPNSWGLDDLILAAGRVDTGRVFAVYGPFLDMYGKAAGAPTGDEAAAFIAGANGAAGYGIPRTESFFYEGGSAQRFDRGLFVIDAEGNGSFATGPAPSATVGIPALLGVFPADKAGSGSPEEERVREIFALAWEEALDRGIPALEERGPVFCFDFSSNPWIIGEDTAGVPVKIFRLYGQGFTAPETGGSALMFYAGDTAEGGGQGGGFSGGLPPRARLVLPPFLDALLSARTGPLPGAEETPALPSPPAKPADDFSRALLRGLSLYGIPLTNALERDGREAQRFSRGWIVRE